MRRQTAQEPPHRDRAPMRQSQLGIPGIELERVTDLALGGKGDALIVVAPGGIWLMTKTTLEFLSPEQRDIGSEMALMVEFQQIGIDYRFALELKFRMTIPEGSKGLGITVRRSRQLENNLPRRMRVTLEVGPIKPAPFLGRGRHRRAIIMTTGALKIRNLLHRPGTLMLLVTDRTGTIRHHVGLVKSIGPPIALAMAALAVLVDRLEINPMVSAIANCLPEFDWS